jgi:chromosome partitioning protein
MKTITLFTQKGGSGKTTLALHLAVSAVKDGRRVAVLDLDPQASAVAWASARQRAFLPPEPLVIPVPINELGNALDGAKNDGFDLVFIDAPPHASVAAATIVKLSDLVLIPCRPSPVDLAAIPATLALVGNKKAAFVVSAAQARVPETAEAAQFLASLGRPVLGPIHQRVSMSRAFIDGKAVAEFEPGGAAALEIKALYESMKGLLA